MAYNKRNSIAFAYRDSGGGLPGKSNAEEVRHTMHRRFTGLFTLLLLISLAVYADDTRQKNLFQVSLGMGGDSTYSSGYVHVDPHTGSAFGGGAGGYKSLECCYICPLTSSISLEGGVMSSSYELESSTKNDLGLTFSTVVHNNYGNFGVGVTPVSQRVFYRTYIFTLFETMGAEKPLSERKRIGPFLQLAVEKYNVRSGETSGSIGIGYAFTHRLR